MAMRTRKYFVIYYETVDEKTQAVIEKKHSQTRDQFDSMRTLGALLKAGVKARCQEEYF